MCVQQQWREGKREQEACCRVGLVGTGSFLAMIYHMMCNHVIYSLMYNGSTADSVHWDCCSVLMYCVLKKAAFLMVDKTGFSQRAPIYGGHVRLM